MLNYFVSYINNPLLLNQQMQQYIITFKSLLSDNTIKIIQFSGIPILSLNSFFKLGLTIIISIGGELLRTSDKLDFLNKNLQNNLNLVFLIIPNKQKLM